MSLIQEELDRVTRALHEPQEPNRYGQLYAAQQALAWVVDPDTYAAPGATILDGLVQPPTCTPEGQVGCLPIVVRPRPDVFSAVMGIGDNVDASAAHADPERIG